MSWLAFALLAGIASAVNVWSTKLLVGRARPDMVAAAVHLLGGLMCVLALPMVGVPLIDAFAPAPGMLLQLAFMGVVVVAGNLFYFRALAQSELSEIDLFLRSSALWTLLLGALALAERLPPLALVGALLVLASVVTVAHQPRRWTFSRPQALALAAAVGFGLGNVIDKAIAGPFHPLAYSALHLLLGGVGLLAFALKPGSGAGTSALALATGRVLMQPGAWLVALTFALTQWLLIEAYAAGGQAGDVILVAQVRLAILLTVGVLLLRERERLPRKITATVLMLIGIALLSRA